MARPVTMMDVRAALRDDRFLAQFPELSGLVGRYRTQKHCGSCGVELARAIIEKYPERVREYFPGREVLTPREEAAAVAATEDYTVINCKTTELEAKLRRLPPGRKYVTVARWQDEVTVIVNHLGYIEAS